MPSNEKQLAAQHRAREACARKRAEFKAAVEDRVAERPPITEFLGWCPLCGKRVPRTAARIFSRGGFFCDEACRKEMELVSAEIEIYAPWDCVVCHRSHPRNKQRMVTKTCGRVRCKHTLLKSASAEALARFRRKDAARRAKNARVLERKHQDPDFKLREAIRKAALAKRKKQRTAARLSRQGKKYHAKLRREREAAERKQAKIDKDRARQIAREEAARKQEAEKEADRARTVAALEEWVQERYRLRDVETATVPPKVPLPFLPEHQARLDFLSEEQQAPVGTQRDADVAQRNQEITQLVARKVAWEHRGRRA